MSSTDSHGAGNVGHETSDFNWNGVIWALPIAVIILVGFFYVSIVWFKGAKDHEIADKQSAFQTTELNELHAKESEILNSYKWVDKDKGRVQIPVDRAMELMAKEHQNVAGREWKPITDTYLQGAAFAPQAAAPAGHDDGSGVSIEDAAPAETKGHKAKQPMAEGQKATERIK